MVLYYDVIGSLAYKYQTLHIKGGVNMFFSKSKKHIEMSIFFMLYYTCRV
jgi:hypothetical protein